MRMIRPVCVLGDFNCTPGSPLHSFLLGVPLRAPELARRFDPHFDRTWVADRQHAYWLRDWVKAPKQRGSAGITDLLGACLLSLTLPSRHPVEF